MGMGQIRISPPERRDRSCLSAVAVALLTLLAAASEALGFDRPLEASTTLFREGCLRLPTHACRAAGSIKVAYGEAHLK
jgi:hypothetical protein